MTDTDRLNKLEMFLKQMPTNGIAIMPLNNGKLFSIDDLGDEDGSCLGDELCLGMSLRGAIDDLLTTDD